MRIFPVALALSGAILLPVAIGQTAPNGLPAAFRICDTTAGTTACGTVRWNGRTYDVRGDAGETSVITVERSADRSKDGGAVFHQRGPGDLTIEYTGKIASDGTGSGTLALQYLGKEYTGTFRSSPYGPVPDGLPATFRICNAIAGSNACGTLNWNGRAYDVRNDDGKTGVITVERSNKGANVFHQRGPGGLTVEYTGKIASDGTGGGTLALKYLRKKYMGTFRSSPFTAPSAVAGNITNEQAMTRAVAAASARNDAGAFGYFLFAAKGGNAAAQNDVAFAYEHGVGVGVNIGEAFAWYQKSSQQGSTWGMVNLARFYRYGLGTKPDLAAASQWDALAETTRLARTHYCASPAVLQGMLTAEKAFVDNNPQGIALRQLGCGVMAVCDILLPGDAIDGKSVNDRQNHGRFQIDMVRGQGDFYCKGLFVRSKDPARNLQLPAVDSENAAERNKAVEAIQRMFSTFEESFEVGPGPNGHYLVKLLPSSLDFSGTYAAEVPTPDQLKITGVWPAK